MEKVEQNAGFSIDIPDIIGEYSMSIIQDLNNEIIQVFYKDKDAEILIRKGTGTDDISGDYNAYNEIDDKVVTEKGNDGVIYLVNNYFYSVRRNDIYHSSNQLKEKCRQIIIGGTFNLQFINDCLEIISSC